MTDPEQNPPPSISPEASTPGLDVTTYAATYPEALVPPPGPPVAPDLAVAWGWGDLGIFTLVYFGSIFAFGFIVFIAGAIILHIPLEEVQKHTVVFVTLAILAQGLASLGALVYFLVMVSFRRAKGRIPADMGFWQAMGWRKFTQSASSAKIIVAHIFGGIGLALGISLASNYIGQPGPVPFEDFFKTRQTVLMMMVFGILVAPLVEEMMFRAFLYPVVARKFGVITGIGVTGLLFGAMHAPQLSGAWGQIALIVCVGLILTWARARSKTVLASFLLHVSYNTTLFAGILIATHGLRNF